VECSDHGVTPEFIRSIRELGLKDLDVDALVSLADYGISAEELGKAHTDYPDLEAGELVELVTEGLDTGGKKKKKGIHFHIH
jgi:hypothetical protein